MNAQILLIGNDQVIEVLGVQDVIDEEYVNDAVVQIRITTADGTEVSGENWPVTLDNVPASDGDYRGIIEDAVQLSPNVPYTIEVTATATNDRVGYWKFIVYARYRTP